MWKASHQAGLMLGIQFPHRISFSELVYAFGPFAWCSKLVHLWPTFWLSKASTIHSSHESTKVSPSPINHIIVQHQLLTSLYHNLYVHVPDWSHQYGKAQQQEDCMLQQSCDGKDHIQTQAWRGPSHWTVIRLTAQIYRHKSHQEENAQNLSPIIDSVFQFSFVQGSFRWFQQCTPISRRTSNMLWIKTKIKRQCKQRT